jgi:hypothetical protein
MFSQFFKSLLEPFTVTSPDMAAQEDLRYYYGEKRPNAIYSGADANIPLQGPTTTYLGNLIDQLTGPKNMANQRGIDRRASPLEDGYLMPNNALTKDLIAARNTACQNRGSATSTLEFLNNLATNVNASSTLRCGWIYDNANPLQGQAYYGTMDGPVVELPAGTTGTWMWDLNAAKKKLHLSICSGAKNCTDVDNATYNKFCGYCTTSKKFIPITGSVAAYPYDGNNACASSSIVLTASKCPQPTPPPPAGSPAAAAWLANRQVCDPMANGAIPRDCLIQKATQAGCKDQGTLINALSSGSDTNYLDTLMQAASYSKYQELSGQALNETALKTGKITISDALSEFQTVYNSASRSNNLGLKAAAADLCFTKGSFDVYDFCTELQPTSRSPFTLDCLQKAFKRAGGQETGSLYPSGANISTWNANPTWKDVNTRIQNLQADSFSTDRKIQQRAIGQFQGIPLENKARGKLGLINNVEIFWFTTDPNIRSTSSLDTIFLGRRIRAQIPTLAGSSTVPGLNAATASFIYFTEMHVSSPLTFNLLYTGDSGFLFARNRGTTLGGSQTIPMPNDYVRVYNRNGAENGLNNETNKEFSSLYNVYGDPASQTWTSTPWTIQPGGPNVITGYYIGQGKNYNLQYRLSGGEYTSIPGSMLYLIQDPYAPMVSFNVYSGQDYLKYNCTYNFMDKRLSSHKMSWKSGPTGPETVISGDMNYMNFVNGSLMESVFRFKIYSFLTLAIVIKFNTIPGPSMVSTPFRMLPTYPSIDSPGISLLGKPDGTAQLIIGSSENVLGTGPITNAYSRTSPVSSSDGPSIVAGQTYIITINANRTTATNIDSLNSLSVGAGILSELQSDPSKIRLSSPVAWANPRHLEDSNSGASHYFYINGDANCQFHLYSLQMYDYILTGENLGHAANNSWATMLPNSPTAPIINQNPYV